MRGDHRHGRPAQSHHCCGARQGRLGTLPDRNTGPPGPSRFGPFAVVQVGDTSLDYMNSDDQIASQHYAFLVSEPEFDEIFARIRERRLPYWADPGRRRGGEINRADGGRGVYFDDPNRHLLEIITRPYGSGE